MVGLDPRLASFGALIGIFWDAANDPLVGVLNDRVRSRWGRRRSVMLEAANGQRFVLASLTDWEGFDIGNSKDFGKEAARTGANQKLMNTLAARRKSAKRTALESACYSL